MIISTMFKAINPNQRKAAMKSFTSIDTYTIQAEEFPTFMETLNADPEANILESTYNPSRGNWTVKVRVEVPYSV